VEVLDRSSNCPCGSGLELGGCCGPRHDGTRPAETAEALMRSRYSAFVLGRGDYLARTLARAARAGEADELGRWGRSVGWLGLEVRGAEAGGPSDSTGTVRFAASFVEQGRWVTLEEASEFVRVEGEWRYVEGRAEARERRLERNERCPCGSGKKVKACHG